MKLAIIGKSGSGKDYCVDILKKYNYIRYSFSDQVKKIALQIFPWMKLHYEPYDKEIKLNNKYTNLSPREIWNVINHLKKVDDLIFVRRTDDEIEMNMSDNVVISDVRFKCEYEHLKENGYTFIYINPSKTIYSENEMDKEIDLFKDNADYVFNNNFNGESEFINFLYKFNLI